jgi:CHAD domain-containing protein
VFRRRFDPSETTAVRRGLQALARASAPARELDVLGAAADPAGALCAELIAARGAAADGLVLALGAAPARRVLLESLVLTEAGDWRASGDNAAPAAGLGKDLGRRWRRICRLGAAIDGLDAGERHDLRLRIKSLRYALDSLALPGWTDLRAGLVPALRAAQDALGAENDAEAAKARLAGLDLSRTAQREADRLVAGLRRSGARARAARAVRRLVETAAPGLT